MAGSPWGKENGAGKRGAATCVDGDELPLRGKRWRWRRRRCWVGGGEAVAGQRLEKGKSWMERRKQPEIKKRGGGRRLQEEDD